MDGRGGQIDLKTRPSSDLDHKAELLRGRVKAHTKDDCLEWHCKEANRHTDYFRNQFSAHLGGNYQNLGLAHPVKDCRLTTFKCYVGNLEELTQAGLATVCWADLKILRAPVYQRFRLGIKMSPREALQIPSLFQDESPASSRAKEDLAKVRKETISKRPTLEF